MDRLHFHYSFGPAVEWADVQSSLLLALWATEAVHGRAGTHLEAIYVVDDTTRTCKIETSTSVGTDFNRIFAGFLLREFGPEGFQVTRLVNPPKQERDPCQA